MQAFGPLALRQHVAVIDPHLDADDAIRGVRLGLTIVDVRAQRLQRHAPLDLFLGARDFRATKPPTADDLDALGTLAHRLLHGLLHGAAE